MTILFLSSHILHPFFCHKPSSVIPWNSFEGSLRTKSDGEDMTSSGSIPDILWQGQREGWKRKSWQCILPLVCNLLHAFWLLSLYFTVQRRDSQNCQRSVNDTGREREREKGNNKTRIDRDDTFESRRRWWSWEASMEETVSEWPRLSILVALFLSMFVSLSFFEFMKSWSNWFPSRFHSKQEAWRVREHLVFFFLSFFTEDLFSLSQNVSCKRMHRSTHSNALNNQYVIRESRRKEMMAGKKQGSRWWRRGMREETGKTGGKRGKDYREMMMTEGPGSKSSVELKQEGWGWGKKKSHEEKRENQWRHNMVFLYKGVFCFTKLFSCIHSHSSPSPPTESERLHLCSESLSKHIQEGMERMRKKIYREKCHDKSSGPKIKSAASIVIVTPDPWCLLFLQSFSRWPLLFFSLFSTENPAAFFVIISGVSFELKTLANLFSSQRWERRAWRIDLQILLLLWSCLWVTRKQVKPKASKALFKYSLFQCFHTYVCITTDRTEGKIDKYSSRIEKRVHTFIFVPIQEERKKSTWDELKALKNSNGQAVLTLVLFIVGFHYILVRFFFICLPLQLQDSRGYNVLQYTLKGGKQACNYNLRLVQHTLPPVLSK